MNLLNAVQVAASPRSRGLGVLVVMGGAIHAARDVTKAHSASPAAFQSPEFGPLGSVDENYVFYARRLYTRWPAVMPDDIVARVERIPFAAEASNLALRAAIDARVDGLVVEAGRSSHVNSTSSPKRSNVASRSSARTRIRRGGSTEIPTGTRGARHTSSGSASYSPGRPD